MPRVVRTTKKATPAVAPAPRIEQAPTIAPALRRPRVTQHAGESLAPNVRTTERHHVHNAMGDRIGAVWRLACGIWQCTTRNRDGAPRSFDTKTEAEACVRGAVLRAEYRERCIREGRQVEEIEP